MPIPKGCVLDNLIEKPGATDNELLKALYDSIVETTDNYLTDLPTKAWSDSAWAEEFFTLLCAVGEAFEYGLIQVKE